MEPVEKLLSRLEGVKQVRDGHWRAYSPTRKHKKQSLSIRELDNGTLLIHDFGGSSTLEVVEAIGLELCDLYPERKHIDHRRKRERRLFRAEDVLLAIHHDVIVCVLACDLIAAGKASEEDIARLAHTSRLLMEQLEYAGYARAARQAAYNQKL